ncbi:hypothetical protein PQX77_008925 [Marasmius sp. AFHP31]|nr:hypothetical protein PQX77_008925 [Marasmius sp. AFHP31]
MASPNAFIPELSSENVITRTVSTLSVMFFVYGIYMMVFGASVKITWRDKARVPNSTLYLGGTVSLFILATVANAIETWEYVRQATIEHEATRTQQFEELDRFLAGDEVLTIQSVIADIMLVHRCHVIWGSRKRIGYPLFLISALLNIIALASVVIYEIGARHIDTQLALVNTGGMMNSIFFVCIAGFNTILTLMTASRIWWITRRAGAMMGGEVDRRYRTIVAIILESGWIYPLVLIINATVEFATEVDTVLPVSIDPLIWQFAGLAPTLIFVRARSGKSVDSVQQMVSTMQFPSRTAVESQDTQRFHTVDLHREVSRGDNSESDHGTTNDTIRRKEQA